MIYLLAILWFASGFSMGVYHVTVFWEEDFELFSEEFMYSLVFGAFGPFAWLLRAIALAKLPQITLFKARNK